MSSVFLRFGRGLLLGGLFGVILALVSNEGGRLSFGSWTMPVLVAIGVLLIAVPVAVAVRRGRRQWQDAATQEPRGRRILNRGAWELWRDIPKAFGYLRPHRGLSVASVGLTGVSSLVTLAEPWPMAILLDSVLGDHPPARIIRALVPADGGVPLLIWAVSLHFALAVVGNGLSMLNESINARIEQEMVLDLRSDLFQHAQKLSLAFHDERRTGELMSRINYQAASVGNIVMAFPPVAQGAITLVGMFVIAYLIHPVVALVALIILPPLWYAIGLYGTRIVPRLQRVQNLEWQSLSIVHEAMSMLRVIVTFGREGHEYRRFREQGETAVDERVKLTVRQTLYRLGINTLTAAGTALVMGTAAYFVLKGQLSVGELIVLVSYIAAVYAPLEQLTGTVGNVNDQLVQFRSSLELLDMEPEVKDHPGAVEVRRVRGHIRVEDLHFSYPGRTDTLKGVSLDVRAGERVAIVGPTGAGKSTLASLIARLYEPHAGRVLLDGRDVRDIKLRSLRAQYAMVLQEPLLFSGTIAENIRYGRLEATDDDIVDAARAANVHDFITRLPQGYATEVGERGVQLSGGERQRLSVARAFVRDAPILILDEPTSSIDSRTEAVILEALERLMVGRTTIMIAHRLSTVRDADQILVVENGRIVETGSHDDLFDAGGLYRQLCDAQSRTRFRSSAGTPGADGDPIVIGGRA